MTGKSGRMNTCITKGEPTALTAEFLEYILSDEVQEHIVGDLGYIPLSECKLNVIGKEMSSSNRYTKLQCCRKIYKRFKRN